MSTLEKKYQVFVSSTYEDLRSERQEIMHALLELNCIPAGMELFPAADEDQWSLIKEVIDDCDYYIVVVGGRYGNIGPEGLSYTEMEYRYAVDAGKPVIAFLHKNPDSIPAKFTEKSEEGREKLKQFRDLVENKMCKYWTNPQELGSVVSRSLIMLQRKHPGVGWVRGDQLPDSDATTEILRLRRRIDELENQIPNSNAEAPKGTEDLAQGDDPFEIECTFQSTHDEDYEHYSWDYTIKVSWNEIFYDISPLMINESNDRQLLSRFKDFVVKRIKSEAEVSDQFQDHHYIRDIEFDNGVFETTIVQFNALGLISQSVKNRSVKDRSTYWTLTPYGVSVMNRLRAIRKAD